MNLKILLLPQELICRNSKLKLKKQKFLLIFSKYLKRLILEWTIIMSFKKIFLKHSKNSKHKMMSQIYLEFWKTLTEKKITYWLL
jgi:hypothetical protein